MDTTALLALPYLAAAQAQKHVTLNESLRMLDALVQIGVESRSISSPPAGAVDGEAYIIPADATGDWAGKTDQLVAWQDGGWAYFAPQMGWLAWIGDEDALLAHDGTGWITASASNSTEVFGINATASTPDRLTVKSDAVLFSHDDVTPGSGDLRLKLNKATTGGVASIVYQDAFSGAAECGLVGDNAYVVKVSDNGTNWLEGVRLAGDTGIASFPQGLELPDGAKITNNGTTNSSGLDFEGGGVFGKVGFELRSVSGLSGARIEQRTTNAALDIVDLAMQTLTKQMTIRIEGRVGTIPKMLIQDTTVFGATQNVMSLSQDTIELCAPMRLQAYSVSTLPDATTAGAGSMIYVSDESGGEIPAFSDSINWRRISDRAIVS